MNNHPYRDPSDFLPDPEELEYDEDEDKEPAERPAPTPEELARVSRQRRYQLKRVAAGRCERCGKLRRKSPYATRCRKCGKKHKAANKTPNKEKRKSYARRHAKK